MNFDDCLPFVHEVEGGYVNHPADPGGATNKGVIQRTYDRWRKRWGEPVQSVRFITDEEVYEIFKQGYWDRAHCEGLPAPLPLVMLDTAVNMGPGRAVRFLQEAVGTDVDGRFGPMTRAAVKASSGPAAAWEIIRLRENYYRSRPKRARDAFLKGWLNRLDALKREIS